MKEVDDEISQIVETSRTRGLTDEEINRQVDLLEMSAALDAELHKEEDLQKKKKMKNGKENPTETGDTANIGIDIE